MEARILRIYLDELEAQALMAVSAAMALDKINAIYPHGIREMDAAQRAQTNKECFRSVHSFLTHLSNISRLIWPPALSPKQNCFCDKPRAEGLPCSTCVARARSSRILSALGIDGEDHVIKNRVLRDHLEHFDERLDYWAKTSVRKNYIQDLIGPKDWMKGVDASDMMRQYDPTTADFTFRGESHSLITLHDGLQNLLGRTRSALYG
ncbi:MULTISPECIES: hypothetical protein [Pseudomonas syringae group]|uniref:hypothetical protein n=1 Tax=Pseudomonas syringae group TaxID=136849 RepID=UPI0011C47669|nr:hypothetical protein [Pseudomonas syringae group genomosp. 7]